MKKTIKLTFPLGLLIFGNLFWIILTVSSVHEIQKCGNDAGKPYGWYLPLCMAGILIPISIAGFLAGRESKED
jgi:hypothetical protein